MFLYYPLDKIYVTQRFGVNPRMYAKYGLKGHNGIDLRTKFIDSPLGHRYVTAASDGVIETVRYDVRGYGIHIRQRMIDGSLLIYGHLAKPYVQIGDRVRTGQRIGLTDNTGDSTGSHLHFEFRPKGWENNLGNGFSGAVDPLPFMKKL